jgi:hypothetical protein
MAYCQPSSTDSIGADGEPGLASGNAVSAPHRAIGHHGYLHVLRKIDDALYEALREQRQYGRLWLSHQENLRNLLPARKLHDRFGHFLPFEDRGLDV